MDYGSSVLCLESYFHFLYAKELTDIMWDVFRKRCAGCKNGCLPQTRHTCLTHYVTENINLHFDEIVSNIDEDDVVRKWIHHTDRLRNVTKEVRDMYRLKLSCKDWRATDMKTHLWKHRIIKIATNIYNFEKRFV